MRQHARGERRRFSFPGETKRRSKKESNRMRLPCARLTIPSALRRMMNRKNYLFPPARSKREREKGAGEERERESERERERERESRAILRLADQVPCKTRPSSRHADPVFLRPGVSIYPPLSLSLSLSPSLFIFLAAPLPYKLISLLPVLGPAPNN